MAKTYIQVDKATAVLLQKKKREFGSPRLSYDEVIRRLLDGGK